MHAAKREQSACVGGVQKSVGKPDAGNRHVRFDERGAETGRRPLRRQVPRLSSTLPNLDLSQIESVE